MARQVKQQEAEYNRSEIRRVFGGLAPVPFLFLSGVMLDDEQDLMILDWDRDRRVWRELDDLDDLVRFVPCSLDHIASGTDEVIVAVSASYLVDIEGSKAAVGDLPVVHLELAEWSFTSHWSEDKQRALASIFRETIRKLSDSGVRKIHLFLAAPASLSFRLGTY